MHHLFVCIEVVRVGYINNRRKASFHCQSKLSDTVRVGVVGEKHLHHSLSNLIMKDMAFYGKDVDDM